VDLVAVEVPEVDLVVEEDLEADLVAVEDLEEDLVVEVVEVAVFKIWVPINFDDCQ
jgi:hypothetical protein